MAGLRRATSHARSHRARTLRLLEDLVRIPSISSDPRRARDVGRCADRLARELRRIGLDQVTVVQTARHPVVYGEWRRLAGRPTVLIYGHYDVQPAGPLRAWRSPPFEPTRRGSQLYGRGASDDKGQLCALLAGIEAWLRGAGRLPVNVCCLLDGEEEIGSPNLRGFLDHYRPAVDVAVISDTRMLGPGCPTVTVGLRGLLNLEIEVRGPRTDLHAGTYGGAVHNPLQAMAELLAGLHHSDGRVAVAGFYDRVRQPDPVQRRLLGRTAPTDALIRRLAGVALGWGEVSWTLHERTTLRPAITINGLAGGHQGPGAKSVIPAKATAKVGIRLVPDQDPDDIVRLLARHFARTTPKTVRTTVRVGSRVSPVVLDVSEPVMAAVHAACLRGFGNPPAVIRSGGTIPAAGILRRSLDVPVVLLGFALPDDGAHAPNERFHLENLWAGTETCVHLLAELATRVAPPRPVASTNHLGSSWR